jgi:hypothetical protein
MVTTDAAAILRLSRGEGSIASGHAADMIAVRDCGKTPAQTLLGLRTTDLRMVMLGGRIKLFSHEWTRRTPSAVPPGYHLAEVGGAGGFWLDEDLPALYREASRFLGSGLTLAGRRIRPRRAFAEAS